MILDTNVVSELALVSPTPAVVAFAERHRGAGFSLSVVTEMELSYGVRTMPQGKRRTLLERGMPKLMMQLGAPSVLAFGTDEALACADILAKRGRMGRSLDDHLRDAMIAATARVAGLPLATRNTSDFEGLGLTLIDPWAAGAP